MANHAEVIKSINIRFKMNQMPLLNRCGATAKWWLVVCQNFNQTKSNLPLVN